MDRIVSALARQHGIPGWALSIRQDGQTVVCVAGGVARIEPERAMSPDTPFDLASLTKPLVGSLVTAALIESGDLHLDSKIASVHADVDPRITVKHLLTHTSGLPAWMPLYQEVLHDLGTTRARSTLLHRARRSTLDAVPGEQHVYSDIGFLVLLSVLETVGGARIDALFDRLVVEPCGLTSLTWGAKEAAATEDCPVRGMIMEGRVHDLNADALGGLSTHAGLFGTAAAVSDLGERCREAVARPESSPLPGRTLRALWSVDGPGSHCGGWDRISRGRYTSTGRYFPDDSVGHLGYTGNSLWVVPSRRITVTLLTNRIHPVDDLTGIRAFRPAVHDAVSQRLGWDKPTT